MSRFTSTTAWLTIRKSVTASGMTSRVTLASEASARPNENSPEGMVARLCSTNVCPDQIIGFRRRLQRANRTGTE